MDTVRFYGEVIPAGSKLTLDTQRVECKSALMDFSFTLEIHVKESSITIECTTPSYSEDKFNDIYVVAFNLAQGLVDLAAFASGHGWRINIDRFQGLKGNVRSIRLHDAALEGISSAYKSEDIVNLPPLLLTNDQFLMVLNDLIQANVYAKFVVINSARAVEGIRNMLDRSERNEAWATMRQKLNLTKEYIGLILDNAKNPRHGNWDHIPRDTNQEIVRRAWKIMDRYIAYRLGGELPLDEAAFPRL